MYWFTVSLVLSFLIFRYLFFSIFIQQKMNRFLMVESTLNTKINKTIPNYYLLRQPIKNVFVIKFL